MGRFMVVSKEEKLPEYKAIEQRYDVGFEINDFYEATVLDDAEMRKQLVQRYLDAGIPEGSTMHGAFIDIAVFSDDERIADISKMRMRQSMEIAKQLGVCGVVFHTNYNPMLTGDSYDCKVVWKTAKYVEELLKEYPEIHIYLENMFDTSPKILLGISERLCKYSNYGVCLDYAHASLSGFPMGDWVEMLAPYLKHIHISDNDLNRDLHMAVGSGYIDWNQFIKYYRTYFDQCTVLVENMRPEDQIQSLNYLRDNFVGLFQY